MVRVDTRVLDIDGERYVGTSTSTKVVVEELSHHSAIIALEPEWERLRHELRAQGGSRGPFLSARWFAVFASSVLASPGRTLRLLIARRAGRLCGVVPLFAEHRRLAGVPARVLRSLTDDHSQRFDALILDDDTACTIINHLAADRGWDALELRETLDGEATLSRDFGPTGTERLIAAACAQGLPTGRWWGSRSPYLPLPLSASALEARLSPKFRANLRRRARNLARDRGPLALELVTAPRQVAAALDDGLRLEAAGWKGEEGTAILSDRDLEWRYRTLARVFASAGLLALYFLRVGGDRIAFHFGLIEEDVYYLLKPGYDPSVATYGPGHLLVDLVARDLIRRGVREFDFLGGPMPWKEEWTPHARPKTWRYIFSPQPFGRMLASWRLGLSPPLRRVVHRLRRVAAGDRAALRIGRLSSATSCLTELLSHASPLFHARRG